MIFLAMLISMTAGLPIKDLAVTLGLSLLALLLRIAIATYAFAARIRHAHCMITPPLCHPWHTEGQMRLLPFLAKA